MPSPAFIKGQSCSVWQWNRKQFSSPACLLALNTAMLHLAPLDTQTRAWWHHSESTWKVSCFRYGCPNHVIPVDIGLLCHPPGFTSSEQQARTQACSDRTTRAPEAVIGLLEDFLTLIMTFWCCLKKQVSDSMANTGSDVVVRRSSTATTSLHDGGREAGGVMAAAGIHSAARRTTAAYLSAQLWCKCQCIWANFILLHIFAKEMQH